MTPFFDDSPEINHHHAVGAENRAQPVRDDQRRPPPQQLLHRFLHQAFAVAVETRRRLVENYHRRIFQKHAGNCQPLPLPPGEFDAALSNQCVESVAEPVDELRRVGRGRRIPYRLFRWIASVLDQRVGDVLADRSAEERRLLRHYADRAPEVNERKIPDIVPVERYRPLVHVPESWNQRRDRRFPRAARPYERYHFPRSDAERDVGDHVRQRRRIPERHMREFHVAPYRLRQRRWAHGVEDGGLGSQQVERPPRRPNGFLVHAKQRAKRSHGAGDVEGVEHERHERPGGERSLEHQPPALPQHRDHATKCAEGEDPEEHRPDPRPVHRRRDHVRHVRRVAPRFFRLARKALHRPDLRECLFRRPCRLRDAILHSGARPLEHPSEQERGSDHYRHNRQSRRRQLRVRHRQQHHSAYQEERLSRELRQIVAQHGLYHHGVGRETADQLSGALFGKESGRETYEVGEQVAPQLGDDALGCHRQQIDLHVVERRLDGE